jgi:hypothetical protein
VAGAALARWNILRHAIDIHGGVGAVRALGGEAAHAEAVAGITLVDVVGHHARHAAEDVGHVAADVDGSDLLGRDAGDGGRQQPAGDAGCGALVVLLAAFDLDAHGRRIGRSSGGGCREGANQRECFRCHFKCNSIALLIWPDYCIIIFELQVNCI